MLALREYQPVGSVYVYIYIYIRPLAVSYGWTILNRTKVKCLVVHPILNLQNGPYKMSVGHAYIAPESPKCYLGPCCDKVKLAFKLSNSSPILATLWRSLREEQSII